MQENQILAGLMQFLDQSPTPYHATGNIASQLEQNGFIKLSEGESWDLDPNGNYYITRNDSSIIAWRMQGGDLINQGLRISGAHTDSPCLKVKPQGKLHKEQYLQFGVEVYGGALLNPWFDRDLSMAGRVHGLTTNGQKQSVLLNFQRPIAIIPSLAIHLDREVNENRSINAQKHLPPIVLLNNAGTTSMEQILQSQIQSQYGDALLSQILAHELYLYDSQPAAQTGLNGEFISSARLDNLLSCYVNLQSFIHSDGNLPSMLICHDHEEVGSQSHHGAMGDFVKSTISRLCGNHENFSRCVYHSLLLSVDNAHAVHPNYAEQHDSQHGPVMNQGPVIKINANQRYASNSETQSLFAIACRQADVPYQEFVIRSDLACGSTIGPISAAQLGIRTVDVGVAQLAMHSIREIAGSKDIYYLYKAVRQFYKGT